MSTYDDSLSNPFSAPESDLTVLRHPHPSQGTVPATFWERFAAWLLDCLVMFAINCMIGLPLGLMLGVGLLAIDAGEFAEPLGNLVGYGVAIFAGWLYCALQESSAVQATLGKRALGIKVTDLQGRPISFGHATGRYFAKLLSYMTCFVGFLIQPFTQTKQALHDLVASTLVVKA